MEGVVREGLKGLELRSEGHEAAKQGVPVGGNSKCKGARYPTTCTLKTLSSMTQDKTRGALGPEGTK